MCVLLLAYSWAQCLSWSLVWQRCFRTFPQFSQSIVCAVWTGFPSQWCRGMVPMAQLLSGCNNILTHTAQGTQELCQILHKVHTHTRMNRRGARVTCNLNSINSCSIMLQTRWHNTRKMCLWKHFFLKQRDRQKRKQKWRRGRGQ